MEENKKPVSTQKKIFIAVFIISIIIIGICGSILLRRWFSSSSFNHGVEKITTAVKSGFPGKNSIEVSGHTVYVRVWSDGMFDISKSAAMGNEFALEQWDALRDKMYLTVCDMSDFFFWVDDDVLYFSLVSDVDHDKELIVFKNKTLVYDGVHEYLSQNGG